MVYNIITAKITKVEVKKAQTEVADFNEKEERQRTRNMCCKCCLVCEYKKQKEV